MSDKSDLDFLFEKACEQFARRRGYARQIVQIDNTGLHAGSPIYLYCKDCGIPTEVLPEDYLFKPWDQCSQCKGLEEKGWLEQAKKTEI